jgi:putative FmdB family regulatory protein
MPQYEYRCSACEREFEYTQKMSDPELVTCEACGAAKLERLISWTAVRSNSWKAALKADNQREALRGTHAVDLGTEHRFKGNATAPAEPEADAEPAAAPAAPAAAAAAAESGDPPTT